MKLLHSSIPMLVFVSLVAGAQAPAPFTFGSARAIGGMTSIDVDEVNARLSAAGLPRVAKNLATIGLGSDIRVGRLMLGGGWQTMLGRDMESPTYKSRLFGNVALLDASWLVVKWSGTSVYPLAGIGASRTSIAIDRLSDFAFDDGLAHPDRGLQMNGTALLYHLGMGVERQVMVARPLSLTARAGMMRNMGQQRWSAEQQHVTEGPRQYRGGYAQIGIATPLGKRRDALVPMASAAFRLFQH